MILSLRTRLLLGITAGIMVLLAVFSMLIYTIVRQTMIRNFDKSLLTKAKMFSAVIEEETMEDEFSQEQSGETFIYSESLIKGIDFEVLMTQEFYDLNREWYYQILDQDNQILMRSTSLGEKHLECFEDVGTVPAFRETILPDKTPGRQVSYTFPLRSENQSQGSQTDSRRLTVVLAQSTAEIYTHLHFLKWLLLGCSAGVVLLSVGVAVAVIRTSLEPIHSLAESITAVGENNLGQVFPSEDYPSELLPICECLNEAFRRLEKSFKRERQFNANVAHELRTPLAGIQSMIEVCLSRSRQAVQYRNTFEGCLQIVRAMNRMIDTLLMLSKLDTAQILTQKEPFLLREVIDDIWKRFADKANDKGVCFQNTIPTEVIFRSDKTCLEMIVTNILDNAVEYVNSEGQIQTNCEQIKETVIVSVSNTGCLLAPEDIEHVFDAFWRKDASRTDVGKHCGIGLSVVEKMAAALGIKVDIDILNEMFTVHLYITN